MEITLSDPCACRWITPPLPLFSTTAQARIRPAPAKAARRHRRAAHGRLLVLTRPGDGCIFWFVKHGLVNKHGLVMACIQAERVMRTGSACRAYSMHDGVHTGRACLGSALTGRLSVLARPVSIASMSMSSTGMLSSCNGLSRHV